MVRRARDHCRGGDKITDLLVLWRWMEEKFPEAPFFDAAIATGDYPISLAAFVLSCGWKEWQKHAVWALHGELFVNRLKSSKDGTPEEMYRDNLAGALMHKANGLMHMCRCAQAEGLSEISLPCWGAAARPVCEIAALAVNDLRQTCTLRSMKYGSPNHSKSTLPAYEAALKNLATAIDVHAEITESDPKMAAWLRKRAGELVLGQQPKLLEACETGKSLTDAEQRQVQRDWRLADNAASAVPSVGGGRSEDMCVACNKVKATFVGFSCRCQCLCRECAGKSSSRIQECPKCGDFTEFVASA